MCWPTSYITCCELTSASGYFSISGYFYQCLLPNSYTGFHWIWHILFLLLTEFFPVDFWPKRAKTGHFRPKKINDFYQEPLLLLYTKNAILRTVYILPFCFLLLSFCFLRFLLELRKNYQPGGNSNPKKYAQIFQTQKNTGAENFRPKKKTSDPPPPPPPPSRLYPSNPPGAVTLQS